MSSLWTPEGERPVGRPATGGGPEGDIDPRDLTEEEVAEQMAALRDELAKTPVAAVVANHAYGIFELAALHLSLQPPQLGEAQLAIDALATIVEGLVGRLGEHESNLKEGLAQLRLAFVQIRAANLGRTDPPPS
ncbi:MAG TPA: hypothetical protein VF230_18720 [Acidimicrobiales bacterium]